MADSHQNQLEIAVPETVGGSSSDNNVANMANSINTETETLVNGNESTPKNQNIPTTSTAQKNKRKKKYQEEEVVVEEDNNNNEGANDGTGDTPNEEMKVKRRHTNWAKKPEAKQRAVEVVITFKGAIRPALRKLRSDKDLNVDGMYDDLPPGTLQGWYQQHLCTLAAGGLPPRKLPSHMCSIVSEEVTDEMFKALDKLSEDEVTMNSSVIRPVLRDILLKKQPEILPPPEGQGTFKLSRGWINNIRLKWKKTRGETLPTQTAAAAVAQVPKVKSIAQTVPTLPETVKDPENTTVQEV
jgi:hypothetical protein